MTSKLGDRIREIRKQKGLTLDDLAELTESSKSYIWELENKDPPRPSAEKLSKIAEKLETTILYLLDGDSEDDGNELDLRFYRQYRNMDPSTKKKIRQIVELWRKEK